MPGRLGAGQNDTGKDFVRAILGDTEDVWGKLFQAAGKTYEQPRLVQFGDAVESACGGATSATGPFGGPGDHQVYVDTSFFADMKRQLGGGGDFAEAYVIAHEVGHHVQTLLGVSAKVNAARRNGENVEGDAGRCVRQELQADCYAGVWGHHAQKRHAWLEPGEIEEAMNTATAVRWFKAGFEKGEIAACDTFGVKGL